MTDGLPCGDAGAIAPVESGVWVCDGVEWTPWGEAAGVRHDLLVGNVDLIEITNLHAEWQPEPIGWLWVVVLGLIVLLRLVGVAERERG